MEHIFQVNELILQLRLTTLMRSAEVANITWALYHMECKHYTKITTKMGQLEEFSIQGQPLPTLIEYMHEYVNHPAPFLIRCAKDTMHGI